MKYTRLLIKTTIWFLFGIMLMTSCNSLGARSTPTPEPTTDLDAPTLVNATGKVVPAQWSKLAMTVPGVVEEIMVREGDQVKAGHVLLRLKGKEDLQAAISAAQAEKITAEKALSDLYDNVDEKRTAALKEISSATKEVRDAQYQMDNFTMSQLFAGLSVTQALSVTLKKLDKARLAFEPYKYYPSGDKIRKDLKEDLDDGQADYNSAVKQLQYMTELEVAKEKLSKAHEDYETWAKGPDPKEVVVAQSRLDNANAALAAAEAKLNDLELDAPFDGTVSEINVRPGEWVNFGQTILLIADLAHLQVETTDLNEIDAARIAIGNPVQVTFDALPGLEVNGKIMSIAPKASEGSGVNYKVVILLDQIPEALRWGMTAFTDIEVNH